MDKFRFTSTYTIPLSRQFLIVKNQTIGVFSKLLRELSFGMYLILNEAFFTEMQRLFCLITSSEECFQLNYMVSFARNNSCICCFYCGAWNILHYIIMDDGLLGRYFVYEPLAISQILPSNLFD